MTDEDNNGSGSEGSNEGTGRGGTLEENTVEVLELLHRKPFCTVKSLGNEVGVNSRRAYDIINTLRALPGGVLQRSSSVETTPLGVQTPVKGFTFCSGVEWPKGVTLSSLQSSVRAKCREMIDLCSRVESLVSSLETPQN